MALPKHLLTEREPSEHPHYSTSAHQQALQNAIYSYGDLRSAVVTRGDADIQSKSPLSLLKEDIILYVFSLWHQYSLVCYL